MLPLNNFKRCTRSRAASWRNFGTAAITAYATLHSTVMAAMRIRGIAMPSDHLATNV